MQYKQNILALTVTSLIASNAFAVCFIDAKCPEQYNPCASTWEKPLLNTMRGLVEETALPIACNPANASSQALFNITNASFASISNRIDNLRDADLLTMAPAALSSMQANHTGIASGLQATKEIKSGLWVKAIGNNARQDMRNGFDGYKSRSAGVTVGADTQLDSDTLIGAAFTAIDTDINLQNASKGSGSGIKSYQSTGYLNRDYGTWHLDALLAYTRQQTRSERQAGFGTMNGKYASNLVSSRMTAGKRLNIARSKMVITPFVSLQYDHLKQDGYTETGFAPLTVNSTTASRLTSGLGARLVREVTIAGRQVKPSLTAQWLHDFRQDGLNTSGSIGGGTFINQGQKGVRNMAGLGASVMVPTGRNAAVSVGYNYEGANKYQNHGYELVYQYWF